MSYQYRSICRKGKSIFEQVEAAGVDPNEYISFYNLRGYDRINCDKAMIQEMEQKSGVTYHEAQGKFKDTFVALVAHSPLQSEPAPVAVARVFLGDQGFAGAKGKVRIHHPLDGNTDVQGKADGSSKKGAREEAVSLPQTEDEARELIRRFEEAAPRSDAEVKDSIASNILAGVGSTKDEVWRGSEEDEKNAYVTEETYIHSKVSLYAQSVRHSSMRDYSLHTDLIKDLSQLMIVDDRRFIIGSANLNDRSQKGDGDR